VWHFYKNKIFALLAVFIAIFTISFIVSKQHSSNLASTPGAVAGVSCIGTGVPCAESPVTVTAFIRIKEMTFKVYPEKRHPPVSNWSTVANVNLVNCNTSSVRTFNNITTNNQGEGTFTIPFNNPLQAGDYEFLIKGASHLRERFNCYNIDSIEPSIDLTPEGKELLAGEVSNVDDNYINSLDMSVLILDLFTTDYYSDLNQDNKVNALDFSNQIYNLFVSGD